MARVRNGDPFPRLRIPAVGGGTLSLPDDLVGSFGVVLTYRGAWCPFCVEQLQGYAAARAALDAASIKVAAVSVDDEATATALARRLGPAVRIGYGADAGTVAAATGALVNPVPHHLQPSAFMLAPDGSVLLSALSSGPVGRLTAAEAVRMVTLIRARRAAIAGTAA